MSRGKVEDIAPVDGKSYNYLGNEIEAINNKLDRIKMQNDAILKCLQVYLGVDIKTLDERIQKAIDFINDDKNYFEDGENWENVTKIRDILNGEELNTNHIPYID